MVKHLYFNEFVYLCVAHLKKWSPVAWGKVNNNQVTFNDIRPKVVYVPAHYQNGKMVLFGYPFLLKKSGQKHYFSPKPNETERVICLRKCPYENTNLVKKGDTYELLYWGISGWKSVEKRVANQTSVTFDKVPKNAILDLKNLSRGRMERVFYYQNNQQIY